jgi:uncharacterized protein (TIGR02118 family)
MSVTLMALYRRPEGGDEAVETFRRRYRDEHLPLARQSPGLRSLHVARVAQAFSDSDLYLVARLVFDDRAALDEALRSDPMRAAGKVLREIAPGDAVTMLVVEPDGDLGSEHAAEKHADEGVADADEGVADAGEAPAPTGAA